MNPRSVTPGMPVSPDCLPKISKVPNATGTIEANTMPNIIPLIPANRQMMAPRNSASTNDMRRESGKACQKVIPPLVMSMPVA